MIKDEIFDLPATVREATDSFAGDAKRKEIDYSVVEHPGVPQFVVGDQRRVRQAVSNVTANAIQHTSNGAVKIELWLAKSHEGRVDIDIVVQDTGTGMSAEKLDALFNDLEQVQTESDEGLQEKLAGNAKAIEGKEKSKRTLGLGLALVARIVRNMNGQLRLKSEEGKGSRFVMQLAFDLPKEDKKVALLEDVKEANVGPPSDQPSTPPVEIGEVMLVNKSAQKPVPETPSEVIHRKSAESVRSVGSMKSFRSGESARSDVDRLIEAIQEPMTAAPGNSDDKDTEARPGSRDSGRKQGSSLSSRRPISGIARAHSANLTLSRPLDQVNYQREGPGRAVVTDSRTPIRPIRMPGETSTGSPDSERPPGVSELSVRTPARVLFDVPDEKPRVEPTNADELHVLVAEDDPINSKIIKKRLEKLGHEVCLTINGEECSSTYGERPAFFDIVLMDMQVCWHYSPSNTVCDAKTGHRCLSWTV